MSNSESWERKDWCKRSLLGLHPKNLGKPSFIKNGKSIYGNDVKFKDLVKFILDDRKVIKYSYDHEVKEGRHKGDIVKDQKKNSSTKVSDFIRNVYGVDTSNLISVANYVRNCLLKLYNYDIVDRDYITYISSLQNEI